MYSNKNQKGFTLIEIAIVLLIVTILLGYTVAMFPVQQELKRYREANAEMNAIIDSLIGFAQVNGRLPCPDTAVDSDANVNSIDGEEDRLDLVNNVTGAGPADGADESCEVFYGFLPSGTLGMTGKINANGQLQDPWGNAYRYAISDVNFTPALPLIDLVVPNEIRNEGLSNVAPDLFVCDDSPNLGNHLNCPAGTNQVVGNVAVVIISLGKNATLAGSNIQAENTDDFDDGTNDKVYISAPRNDTAGAAYDDIVKWISPNLLFSKMIEADQLP